MGFLCPKDGCEREFDSDRGVKLHHYHAHGESIAFETVECSWCGSDVEKRVSEVKRTERSFCDEQCKQEEFASRQSGEDNPLWDDSVSKRTHICKICGEEYENYKDSSETKCCSRECYAEWMAENRVGEKAYAWKGGRYFYYGPSWQQQRKKCLENAGFVCERCGMSNDEHKNEHDQSLHVHHIKRFKRFGLERHEQANRQENLMAVCRDCHYKVEGKELSSNRPNTEV